MNLIFMRSVWHCCRSGKCEYQGFHGLGDSESRLDDAKAEEAAGRTADIAIHHCHAGPDGSRVGGNDGPIVEITGRLDDIGEIHADTVEGDLQPAIRTALDLACCGRRISGVGCGSEGGLDDGRLAVSIGISGFGGG